jgi:hypothetical protein
VASVTHSQYDVEQNCWTTRPYNCITFDNTIHCTSNRSQYNVSFVAHLVQEVPAFHITRRFITVLITARQLFLSWARRTQPTLLSYFFHIHFNINLPSTPRFCKRGFSGFPTKILHASPTGATCPKPSHHHWLYHPSNIWWGEQIMKLLVRHFSLVSPYFLTLRSKYFPQHPVFECERPSFTPIQNNKQHYRFVHFNILL